MSTPLESAGIDAKAIEQYRRDGVVVVEGLLDDLTRQRMKQVLAELIERAREVHTHTDIYDLEPTHSAAQPRVRRIKRPHLVHPVFAEFMRSPRLLAVLSALLGPRGVRLHGSKLNLKAPEIGSSVEWHQDWAFYPHTNDDILAVGVLLDDATEHNGPLMVLPGTHRGPTFDHHGSDGRFCGAMEPARDGLDFSRARALIAPAGACSFHHVRAVHGSAQNRSAHSRNLLLYEFAAADAFPLLGIPDWDEFNSRLLVGAPTVVPRIVDCPVRMPLPPATHQGSIYENQTALQRRYFDAAPLAAPQRAT
jgi:phytanoyl-CoA hydroxylase